MIAFIVPIISIFTIPFFVLLSFNSTRSNFSGFSISVTAQIAFSCVTVAGLILFILAMKKLSNHYQKSGIYKNALLASTFGIVVQIISVSFAIINLAQLPSGIFQSFTASTGLFSSVLIGIGVLFLNLIFGILSGIFYMFAFNNLASASGQTRFRTVGLLFLIGAILTIVLIGGIIVWLSWIFAFASFLALTPTQAFSSFSYPISTPTTSNIKQIKYCSYCGAKNDIDALYCQSCGKKIQ